MRNSQRHIHWTFRFGVGVLVSIISLTIYILTLAPTVTFIDSGELAAVCSTLGIAHPTGYPVYTLIGRLFLLFPFSSNKVFQLNFLSALFAALTVLAIYNVTSHLQRNRGKENQEDVRQYAMVPFTLLTAGATALLLGFSKTFWSQALITEVYSLHAFFVSLIIMCVVTVAKNPSEYHDEKRSVRFYALGAYLFGLGMANHMTIIVLAPACVYLLIAREGIGNFLIKVIKILLPCFLLGLSSYLFLPIRSAAQPSLDWGNPETIGNFFRHLSGKQYQVWMFSSFDIALKQCGIFFKTLPAQFSPFYIPLAFLGLWKLYRKNKRILWFTVIVFIFDLLYSINYDIHDIESYFLPCFIVTAIWIGMGFVQIGDVLTSKSRVYQYALGGLTLLSPIVPLLSHYTDVDRHGDYFVHDYAHNLLKGVDHNSIIISRQWDFFCSPFYYFQYVEGVRPDVVLIEQELLRRSWYYPQLKRQYPWLIQSSQEEVSGFLNELEKFERGQPYEQHIIQKKYINMINSFIHRHIDSRPIYLTPEVEPSIGFGCTKVPEGLALRLYQDTQFRPLPKLELHYRGLHDRPYEDYLHRTVISLYVQMWTTRGLYLSHNNRYGEASEAFREALRVDPNNQQARNELERCRALLQSEDRP